LFEDSKGYHRLAIDKKRKYSTPVASFALLVDAHRMLWKLVKEFELHPVLCFLDNTGSRDLPEVAAYNQCVPMRLEWMHAQKETFLIRDKEGCILVEEGKFYGMGQLAMDADLSVLETVKAQLTEYPENEVIRSMIRNYSEKFPAKVIRIA
jgi:DNA polymerase-3 subunit epsilon